MALSARDRRIFSAIERDLTREDPRWTRRCARRTRRFDRLERGRLERGRMAHGRSGHSPLPGLVRRRLSITAAFAAWIALVCADASRGPGGWLWAALAATAVAVALTVLRGRTRRRRRGGGLVL